MISKIFSQILNFVEKRQNTALGFILLLAFIPKILVLFNSDFAFEGDEAIVGLMAKHISEGLNWPIFYYGQSYMGSLEPTLIAVFYKLFGVSKYSLKIVPLIFSLFYVYTTYLVLKKLVGVRAAFLSTVLMIVPSSVLTIWGSKARGGFIEFMVLGNLSLYYALGLLEDNFNSLKKILLMGLFAGIGWWTNNQIIYYFLVIATLFLHEVFIRQFLILRVGIKKCLYKTFYVLAFAVPAFIFGSMPFWYYNLTSDPKFATIKFLFEGKDKVDSIDNFKNIFEIGLPILFGARRLWRSEDIVFGSTFLLYLILSLVLAILIINYKKINNKRWLFVPFFGFSFFIFSTSQFGWFIYEPRYLFALYLPFYLMLGVFFEILLSREAGAKSKKINVLLNTIGSFVFIGILLIGYISNFYGKTADAGGVRFGHAKNHDYVSPHNDQLIDYLKKRGFSYIKTGYWLGYQLALESREEIKFLMVGQPRLIRIRSYEDVSDEVRQHAPLVLGINESYEFEEILKRVGLVYVVDRVDNYGIFYDMKPMYGDKSERVDLSSVDIIATHHQDAIQYLKDGDLSSRWGSASPQNQSMSIKLKFAKPLSLTGIRINYGPFPQDYARGLRIEAKLNGDTVSTLFEGGGVPPDYISKGGVAAYFPPVSVDQLEILQTGSHPVFDWSIAELELDQLKK